MLKRIFGKHIWLDELRRFPIATIVSAIGGAAMTALARFVGIPTIDNWHWPLTGLGYIVLFFVCSFLLIILIRLALGGSAGSRPSNTPKKSPLTFKGSADEYSEIDGPPGNTDCLIVVGNRSPRTIRGVSAKLLSVRKIKTSENQEPSPGFSELPLKLDCRDGGTFTDIPPGSEAAFKFFRQEYRTTPLSAVSRKSYWVGLFASDEKHGGGIIVRWGLYDLRVRVTGDDVYPETAHYVVNFDGRGTVQFWLNDKMLSDPELISKLIRQTVQIKQPTNDRTN